MPAQHLAWVAVERRAVEMVDVAEHARLGGAGLAPREELERVGIGDRQHVSFLDAREPVDRRAVERHAVLERVLELGGADREALQIAEHVGEPQAHESHAAFFDSAQHVVAMLIEHLAHLTSLVGVRRRENVDGAPPGVQAVPPSSAQSAIRPAKRPVCGAGGGLDMN